MQCLLDLQAFYVQIFGTLLNLQENLTHKKITTVRSMVPWVPGKMLVS